MRSLSPSTDRASTWCEPGQIERLRTACYEDQFSARFRQRNEAILATLYDTGLRVGELVELDVEHLDRDAGTLRRPPPEESETRTGGGSGPEDSTLELDPEHTLGTVRLLASYCYNRPLDGPVLFPSRNGGRLTPKAVRDVVAKAAEAAGVRPYTPTGRGEPSAVSPRTLRHSTAWRLLEVEDRPLTAVRDRLGHTALSTTRSIYDHFEADDGGGQNRSTGRFAPGTGTPAPERSIIDDVLDTVPDVLYAFDAEGRMIWWNDRMTEVTGYTDAEIREMHPLEFIGSEDSEAVAEAIARVIDRESVERVEAHLTTKDGEHHPSEFTGAPLTDEEGDAWGVAGVGRDIAARKRFERISDGFYALDTDWRFTYLNSSAEALLHRSAEELAGTVIWEAFPEAVDTPVYEAYHAAMESQEPVSFDQYYPPLGGWFDVRAYPSETGLSVYFRDITDRKERERELEQYRTLVEAANDVILTVDDNGVVGSVNPAVTDVFGYAPEKLPGEQLTTLLADDSIGRGGAVPGLPPDTGRSTQEGSNVELSGIRADGSTVPLAVSFSEAEYDDQQFAVGVLRDITDRKKRQEELAYRKALLEAQAETTIHGLLVVDTDREVLFHNEQFLELWDIPEAVSSSGSDEDLLECVRHRLAAPEEFFETVEYLYEHPEEESRDTIELTDGRWFDRYSAPIVHDGTHYGRLWVFRDITDRKERERELERRRTELARLNRFNEFVQDLAQAAVAGSTRAEIERTVCDRLVAPEFYRAAWIGETTQTTATVTPSAWAGLDPETVPETSVDGDDTTPMAGLAERAIETRETCLARVEDDVAEDRRDRLRAAGVESALAVPIEYSDALYGVLVVHSSNPTAFGDRQRSGFADLGETIGFAITAAERKDALVADSVLELTLEVRDPEQFFLCAAAELEASVVLEGVAGRGDAAHLEYFTITGAPPAEIRDLVARTEGIEAARVVSTRGAESLWEVRVTDRSIVTAAAKHGGTVTDMTAEDDHGTVGIELPQTVDPGRVLDALEGTVTDVDLRAKRAVDRPIQTEHRFGSTVTDRLTDRQRDTLEAAYLAGFFENPRRSTGEDIADSMGISSSTFHQHLRASLRKLVAPIVET